MGSYREHENLVDKLYNKVNPIYDDCMKEIEYYHIPQKNPEGEMDVVGWRPGRLDIYEVKSNGNKQKARKQLQRAKDYFSNIFQEVNLFYYGHEGLDVSIIKEE